MNEQPTTSDSLRYVEAHWPRCPRCESTDHTTTRSDDNGDGTRTQHRRCRECNHLFRVIWQ